MKAWIIYLFLVMAVTGIIPVIALLLQFGMVGLHGLRNHYSKCKSYTPRIAVLIPAWNEGEVIGNSIDRLMHMNYPEDAVRLYIIDDGSTDQTVEILKKKAAEYPGKVIHLRRENGGQGKAHTLNYGLKIVLSEPWAQALLIMDADIMFEHNALLKMARHLADPEIGAVTAYIKEGSKPTNKINNYIAYEYITAQAGARRAQNVLGVLACLAGGAQLHSRTNIEAIGGQIDTTTLAEDTFTTFETQLVHHKVIFEPNAISWAEEPDSLYALWKQRFRWSRGNVALTIAFRHIWFRITDPSGLGGLLFGLIWFSVLLMPIFMLVSSAGLIGLFFLQQSLSWSFFLLLAKGSAIAYLFITVYSFLLDFSTTKRSWLEGLLFPGIISLIILLISVAPNLLDFFVAHTIGSQYIFIARHYFLLISDLWVSLCMFFAWMLYRLDRAGVSQKFTNTLLLLVGYGPILCVITLCAGIAHFRDASLHWDKTNKSGKIKQKKQTMFTQYDFDTDLAKDIKNEYKIFWYEILVIIFVVALFIFFHLTRS